MQSMMKTTWYLALCFGVIVSSASGAGLVEDENGDEVIAEAVEYIIVPFERGPGLTVDMEDGPSSEDCPLDVVQEGKDDFRGLPLTFHPKDGRVIQRTYLNIKFKASTPCESTVWMRELDESIERDVVRIGGELGGQSESPSWFFIESVGIPQVYKLTYCPPYGMSCKNFGIYRGGRLAEVKGEDDQPFLFLIAKAKTATLSAT